MGDRSVGGGGGNAGDGVGHVGSRFGGVCQPLSRWPASGIVARTPSCDQIMPAHSPPPNALVVALVYDGLCMFEFASAAEVFGLARPELGEDWYRFETCAAESGPLRGQYGMRIQPDGGLERLAEAGTIIVPGWKGVDAPVPEKVLDALRLAHARGARLLSICSGSFVLAATGLLDGRRATTHWRYAEAMRVRYPAVEVDPDVLYVDEGSCSPRQAAPRDSISACT